MIGNRTAPDCRRRPSRQRHPQEDEEEKKRRKGTGGKKIAYNFKPDIWLQFQTGADTPLAHIESEADYERTTAFLNELLDEVRDDAGHPLYSLVALVGDLIEAYEIDQEPR